MIMTEEEMDEQIELMQSEDKNMNEETNKQNKIEALVGALVIAIILFVIEAIVVIYAHNQRTGIESDIVYEPISVEINYENDDPGVKFWTEPNISYSFKSNAKINIIIADDYDNTKESQIHCITYKDGVYEINVSNK